jgi:hypothetical protein
LRGWSVRQDLSKSAISTKLLSSATKRCIVLTLSSI